MSLWMEWLALAGILVVLEMFSGTFYLLMIAIGMACAGLAAWLGAPMGVQLLVGAVVGSGATMALRRTHIAHRRPKAANDPNIHIDIGQTLEVNAWADGKARVQYRGAQWDVELAQGCEANPGRFTITEVRGNRLIVQSQ